MLQRRPDGFTFSTSSVAMSPSLSTPSSACWPIPVATRFTRFTVRRLVSAARLAVLRPAVFTFFRAPLRPAELTRLRTPDTVASSVPFRAERLVGLAVDARFAVARLAAARFEARFIVVPLDARLPAALFEVRPVAVLFVPLDDEALPAPLPELPDADADFDVRFLPPDDPELEARLDFEPFAPLTEVADFLALPDVERFRVVRAAVLPFALFDSPRGVLPDEEAVESFAIVCSWSGVRALCYRKDRASPGDARLTPSARRARTAQRPARRRARGASVLHYRSAVHEHPVDSR